MRLKLPFWRRSREDARPGELAVVLTGGGARGAYQVGLLRWLAGRFPELKIPIVTGVSAGAVNAAYLAAHMHEFGPAARRLAARWQELTPEHVFATDVRSLAGNVAGWGFRLLSGGRRTRPGTQGLVDTEPLRGFLRDTLCDDEGRLVGIADNLRRGNLQALALSTTNYTTGQSVIWVQGRRIRLWSRPQRRAVQAELGIEHVMASAALPIFFPAVRIGDAWYGDGGVRLAAPLSPPLHLGAGRILAVSTRYRGSPEESDRPVVAGYPPPAQVVGTLLNAVFLDLIDQDALRLEQFNRLLRKLPEDDRDGMRIVDLCVVRPSRDLGRLARDLEPRLPRALRFLSRGLGTREATSADMLSMIMFQEDYVRRLIELGERDAEARADELEAFVAGDRDGGEPVIR